jgi:hypothetical protein
MSAQALPRQPLHAPSVRPRELGIYSLPGEGEFVASIIYSGRCSLYPVRGWSHYGGARFRVDGRGRLWRQGEPTHWRVSDLKDTGRTAKYPLPVIR